MIGTTGVNTEILRHQINESFEHGRQVTLGFLWGPEEPQSVRNTSRRQQRSRSRSALTGADPLPGL